MNEEWIIILLHGFTKKVQKLHREELDIALKRLTQFVMQEDK